MTIDKVNALLYGIGDDEFDLREDFDPSFIEFERLVEERMAEMVVGLDGKTTANDIVRAAFEHGILTQGEFGWRLQAQKPSNICDSQLQLDL